MGLNDLPNYLPSHLIDCILRAERTLLNQHRVTRGRVWLYVQLIPERFNQILEENLALIRARYGYEPNEHGDWIHPGRCYCGGIEAGLADCQRPLNSWALKDPVSFVPSFKQIEEKYEWRRRLARLDPRQDVHIPTPEEIHEECVEKACEQLEEYHKLLNAWREVGCPREQSECNLGLTRKQVKEVHSSQRKIMLAAKGVMEACQRDKNAPQFVRDEARGAYAREDRIHSQFYEVLRYC